MKKHKLNSLTATKLWDMRGVIGFEGFQGLSFWGFGLWVMRELSGLRGLGVIGFWIWRGLGL